MENGRVSFKARDVADLLTLYGVPYHGRGLTIRRWLAAGRTHPRAAALEPPAAAQRIRRRDRLGGLIHEYEFAAA